MSLRRRVAAACTTVAVALGLASALAVVSQPADAATTAPTVAAAAAYGEHRGYHMGVAVYDTVTGEHWGAGDHSGTFASESVIKMFIATRLLVDNRMYGTTETRAYKMITQSDDAIASSLYGSVGGDSLINWVEHYYGIYNIGSPPSRGGWWGNTHLIPDGLVHVYAKIKQQRRVGDWLRNAMHHATRYGSDGFYQYFGIPSATSGAAIKQGWGFDYDDWNNSADENTTGFVNGDRYAVAILARGPSNTYGSAIGTMLTGAARTLLPGGVFPGAQPQITGLSVHSGAYTGGLRVTVYGNNFTHVTGVTFGNYPATQVAVSSPSAVSATIPAHPAGTVYVKVLTDHGTTPAGQAYFTYWGVAQVTGFSTGSASAAGGTAVVVHGHWLSASTTFRFGGVAARLLEVISPNYARVATPAHSPGTVHVTASNWLGTSTQSAADEFTFNAVNPAVRVRTSPAPSPSGSPSTSPSTSQTTSPSSGPSGSASGSPSASPSDSPSSSSSGTPSSNAPPSSTGSPDAPAPGSADH